MLKLKLRLILLLITFLSVSCKQRFPEIEPQERCVIVLETTEYDGVPYCRCQTYEWAQQHLGTIGIPKDFDVSYCDRMIGFRPEVYKEVWTWWEMIRLWTIRNKYK